MTTNLNQRPQTIDPGSNPAAPAPAVTAAILYSGFAALQLALAGGAPLGEHVWGGGNDASLPPAMRIASLAAAGLLIWIALVVLARAGITQIKPAPRHWLPPITWAIAGLMALNTIGNITSQSQIEQRLFGPLTALMTVLTVIVARRRFKPTDPASRPPNNSPFGDPHPSVGLTHTRRTEEAASHA